MARSEGADEALLRALYEQHGAAVLAYATRLTRDPVAAQDVLQETLIRAWRHPEALASDRGPIRPWLLTVAARIVVDRARRARARPQEVHQPAAEPAEYNDPVDRLVESIPLYQAVRNLSEPHRSVVIEVYFRGRTISEAAQTLGTPEGTVKSRLFSALRTLRDQLGTRADDTEQRGQRHDREVTA
ncbi:sigma-70 family RNA polymerase sigma factor [Pseudonocardia acaciae]|uniref:sigma-70 family RNA polymerase sigma factor n=1 Tax=Pseudonocardia acaciae TaxID=551276 RepID=UPI000687B429|nr:sigma-70 family RNA polymerase sigma factor [Pseudonocardia acaciae]